MCRSEDDEAYGANTTVRVLEEQIAIGKETTSHASALAQPTKAAFLT